MSWPDRQRGCAPPKLPSPSGLGKMNSVLPQTLSLSPPRSFAGGFETHPSGEIKRFHIPVIFPGLFCFLKTVFICQHVRGMGGCMGLVAGQEERGGIKEGERMGNDMKKHFKSSYGAETA